MSDRELIQQAPTTVDADALYNEHLAFLAQYEVNWQQYSGRSLVFGMLGTGALVALTLLSGESGHAALTTATEGFGLSVGGSAFFKAGQRWIQHDRRQLEELHFSDQP